MCARGPFFCLWLRATPTTLECLALLGSPELCYAQAGQVMHRMDPMYNFRGLIPSKIKEVSIHD